FGASTGGAGFSGALASGGFAAPDASQSGSADRAGNAAGPAPLADGSTTSVMPAQPATTAVAFSPLPAASVRYVFGVFVGLMLLGAVAIPLRH
ncbi:MAG TPA: hypothetical protein VEG38_01340, partial [Acidimicrobiia bacterium]|nr:hypothetical protein [Acidimicrobiia bacterium]